MVSTDNNVIIYTICHNGNDTSKMPQRFVRSLLTDLDDSQDSAILSHSSRRNAWVYFKLIKQVMKLKRIVKYVKSFCNWKTCYRSW